MPEQYDLLEDALQNAEMIVLWSNDPDSTRGTYSGQESALWRLWLKERGIEMVFIDPFHNYTAAMSATSGSPRALGTDAALAMAIAYVWITEDTYDKDYVANRTVGFEEFKPYILGETDGVPKTPRVGGRRVAVCRPASSAAWRASGPPSAPSSPAGPEAARAVPAARRTAPSGRG